MGDENYSKKNMEVINIKTQNLRNLGYNNLSDWLSNPNHFYIGRHNNYIKGATKSKWHNPFKMSKIFTREMVVEKYRDYIHKDARNEKGEKLIYDISELEGKVLGCWCKPQGCHGDVLVQMVQEYVYNKARSNSGGLKLDDQDIFPSLR